MVHFPPLNIWLEQLAVCKHNSLSATAYAFAAFSILILVSDTRWSPRGGRKSSSMGWPHAAVLVWQQEDDARPRSKAGAQGIEQPNHRQPISWLAKGRVNMAKNASLVLVKEKEMQNFFKAFKPGLKASWAGVQICARRMLPFGTACFWDLPAFLQEGGGEKKHMMWWIHT